MTTFRPPQQVLDVFWKLSDGNDDERSKGAVKLAYLINTSEESEKRQILQYCQERLIRGLSSGRKFARIGFSVALVQLLRVNEELDTTTVLSTIKNKLKIGGLEKKLQSEIGGIVLGQAFAISALLQAGRVGQLSGNILSSLIKQLFSIADRKSYLTAVCDRIIQDLVNQVPADVFKEHMWPKVKEKMKLGWKLCTLDRVTLVLTCRNRFPKVVKRKFLRKYWGFPILCEANDNNLLTSILASVQRADILVEQILPQMLETDRNVVSVWRNIGEKLMEQMTEKKRKTMTQRQLFGLKVASKLLASTDQDDEVADVVLSPGLARCIFHSVTKRTHLAAATEAADSLCQQICQKLASSQTSIFTMVERIWKLEAVLSQEEHSSKIELVMSYNFLSIIDLMSTDDAVKYSHVLMAMVMDNDKWQVMSHEPAKKLKQVECCLRQLLHLSTSKLHSIIEIQHSVLSLFLRLAFFHVTKGTRKIAHCESCINLQEMPTARNLSEVYFYKLLDSLLTLVTGQQKKREHLSSYLDLLSGLAHYVQDLLRSVAVVPAKLKQEQVSTEWQELMDFCVKIRKIPDSESQGLSSAFVLLIWFLGFHMMTDFKVAVDLLQDVYVCYEKADITEQTDVTEKTDVTVDENEPHWMDVMMDVLLKVMSLQSRLARVIAVNVFRLLSQHVTTNAVSLITEVLTPNKSPGIGNEDVLVETDEEHISHDEDVEDEGHISHDEDVEDKEHISHDEDVEDEEHISHDEDVEDEEHSSHDDGEDEKNSTVRGVIGEDVSMDTDALKINGTDQVCDTEDSQHGEEEDENLSDMSDSEMFKMDSMLAEVFRQRQSAGKKARLEKRQELINFQIRALDFVEILIKGERCGDFVFNLLKPLVLLILKSGSPVLAERAEGLFTLIKGKTKALRDSVHSVEELKHMFQDLLDLAKKVTDKRHLQAVSMACYVLINTSSERPATQDTSSGPCVEVVRNALDKVMNKKSSKPNVSFFNMLIELDPSQFQELGPQLVHRLKETTLRPHDQMICCLVLASLCKRTDNVKETQVSYMKQWMIEAVPVVTQLILSLDKVMYYKHVLTLTLALQSRQQDLLLSQTFGADIKEHLMKLKSKFNTDIRRLANKIISAIDQKTNLPRSAAAKKRQISESDLSTRPSFKKFLFELNIDSPHLQIASESFFV